MSAEEQELSASGVKITIAGSENLGNFMPNIGGDGLFQDAAKGLRVVDKILASTDEQFGSRSFLLECLLDFGIPLMSSRPFAPWVGAMNASGFGILQYPTEFVDFLRQIIPLQIGDAVEVGSFRGGSSYFLAAILQRANCSATLTMIDLEDNLVCFDLFAEKLNLRKAVPNTSEDFNGQEFDLVFIDGDHSFLGVLRDFSNLGRYARKAVAFHDIHAHEFDGEEGGTVRAWKDIKQHLMLTHSIVEFAHSSEPSLGIGLCVVSQAKI